MKLQNFRQGDICYVGIDKLPEGLQDTSGTIILQSGSGGNPHSYIGGMFYKKEEGDFVLGYLKAKDTKLFHAEHGPKSGFKLPNGFYQVRKQSEETIEGLKPVID